MTSNLCVMLHSSLHGCLTILYFVYCSTFEGGNTVNLHKTTRISFSSIFFSAAFDAAPFRKLRTRRGNWKRDVNARAVASLTWERMMMIWSLTDSFRGLHKTWVRQFVPGMMMYLCISR